MSHRLAKLLGSSLCVALMAVTITHAQSSRGAGPPSTNVEPQVQIDSLRKELEQQRQETELRLNLQNQTMNRELDAVSRTTTGMISLMAGIAVLGSLFGAVSWFKSRQDYQQERKFYEERMTKMDTDQATLTKHQITIGQ